MAAHHNLGPQFMRPGEIKAMVTSSTDWDEGEPMDELWEGKEFDNSLEHSHAPLFRSVERFGVQNPVKIIHGKGYKMMEEGHHHVAAAHTIEQESKGKRKMWIPVTHEEP